MQRLCKGCSKSFDDGRTKVERSPHYASCGCGLSPAYGKCINAGYAGFANNIVFDDSGKMVQWGIWE